MGLQMQGRVIGYVRVGKKDDDSHSFLAGQQIDIIAEWAADNEADVLNWYFDLGVDASEPIDRRPAGAGLLARVKRGDVTDVVVGSLDVLGKGRALLDAVQQL